MELAKGVRDLAKDGVATVQAHLSADASPHSPAAPLRYRRNMEAVVVEDCYHNVRRNELLQLHPTCPEPARRAEMVRGLAPREFELLWLNSSEVKVSNLHRREKPVKLRVDPEQGVTLERAETKKAEEERQVGRWHWWDILEWEVTKTAFGFRARPPAGGSGDSGGGAYFQLTTRSQLGTPTGSHPAAEVGQAFDRVADRYVACLRGGGGGGGGTAAPLSVLASSAEPGGEAPIFQTKPAARGKSSPAVRPTFSGGLLAPPPKSALAKSCRATAAEPRGEASPGGAVAAADEARRSRALRLAGGAASKPPAAGTAAAGLELLSQFTAAPEPEPGPAGADDLI